MINISDRLRQRRDELGMTQEAVAAAAGMNVTQYNGYERGRSAPSDVTLPRLAKALQTTQEALMGLAAIPTTRRASESKREALKRLKVAFEAQVAAELELAPADITVRIEIL
ncbi:helix-turn-helix domain-containing protein [Phenylobacterium sp.]|jgi:transcriptional regulator with XRE-family HTH domain|uniref:helix-turn-helix domain-containing protein n=1 Tax=Phenylobacterium sp. TaxID=1871053 RepID=UPI002F9221A0